MSLSLPADPARARSLTGVLPELIAALNGSSAWFPPASSAIIAVVDGLGARNLTARSGHARFLKSRMTKNHAARTVFPTTTATALTSLLTGTPPGMHGIVGYRLRIPGTDVVSNQLHGWETDGLDPRSWQRAQPLMEREARAGRPCFVVSRAEYVASGFTDATLRGATFHSATDFVERAMIAADLAAQHPGALIYLYAPELDAVAHKHGWESDEWSATLEGTDAAIAALSAGLTSTVGAVITADHGMVDVPRHRQVLLGEGDPLIDGVRLIGGEPRMLHLYAEDGAAPRVLDAWRRSESGRSWVMSRDEAVRAGILGPEVSAEVLPRIGDVVIAARAAIVYYDDRIADKGSQRMVGQHGSLTDEERTVPLIPLGAFA